MQRALIFVLTTAILAGVWLYREGVGKAMAKVPVKVAAPQHAVEILHFHLPEQLDSERLADHLNAISQKYSGQVLVTRVDVRSNPERVKAEHVTQAPEVVIMARGSQAFRFQGLWSRERIEERVEEILRGLLRMEKGWMPPGISRR